MARQIYVNLAVERLDRSVEFFSQLGFEFDSRFTDETATCMIVNDDAYVMLLTKAKFAEFATKQLVDPASRIEAILAVSADSRAAVDELVDTALASGGSEALEPMDYDFMYGRSFHDPDGHLWEVVWMDPSAIEQSPVEAGASS